MRRGGGVVWRAIWAALLAGVLLSVPDAAWAAAKKPAKTSSGSESCVDKDDPPRFPWQKFKSGDTCVEISNTLTVVYQKLLKSSGSVPAPLHSGVATTGNSEVKSVTFAPSINTTTPTGLGDFETSLGLSIKRSSDDTYVYTTLSEGTVALAGVTAGYADSVMNFWSGDFQFSATAPSRTVGVVRYEYEMIPDGKLGLSLETGVATRETNSRLFAPVYPEDPVLAARWLYETDPLTVSIAAMAHRAEVERERRLPGTNPDNRIKGWAATAGTTFAVPMIGDDDEVSAQATYAVNASSYLGTNSDLSTLASRLPFSVDTRGWSVVVSYHREWTEQWESNVFVSHLALDISSPLGNAAIRSTRYAGNIAFKPVEEIKVGGELGFLDVRVEAPLGRNLVVGASGKALTGYLFAEFSF
ncbi:MAG: porin [Pseudolabrys sp.]